MRACSTRPKARDTSGTPVRKTRRPTRLAQDLTLTAVYPCARLERAAVRRLPAARAMRKTIPRLRQPAYTAPSRRTRLITPARCAPPNARSSFHVASLPPTAACSPLPLARHPLPAGLFSLPAGSVAQDPRSLTAVVLLASVSTAHVTTDANSRSPASGSSKGGIERPAYLQASSAPKYASYNSYNFLPVVRQTQTDLTMDPDSQPPTLSSDGIYAQMHGRTR
ncbi:hypothetical protein GGX14DRAFT_576967 [Mycena pura]|uniref:Uncharacterized protein n=1 Tax=Mycena pura TaxID=153505 RepID=A0AAD6USB5_9AGAR|nr:hypothetical protein GGX14DRAFT_576967 [Mycena pura]